MVAHLGLDQSSQLAHLFDLREKHTAVFNLRSKLLTDGQRITHHHLLALRLRAGPSHAKSPQRSHFGEFWAL